MVEREMGAGMPVVQKPFDGRIFMESLGAAFARDGAFAQARGDVDALRTKDSPPRKDAPV